MTGIYIEVFEDNLIRTMIFQNKTSNKFQVIIKPYDKTENNVYNVLQINEIQ
jgi:hypothetical protein